MAIYNDTPLPTETPAQSQPLMRQNFNQIATVWNVDHIPIISASNVGYSNKLTLVDQGLTPPSGVASTDVLYSKTVSGLIELFLQRPAGTAIQLTSGLVTSASPGSTFLPGGIIFKFGSGVGNNTSSQTVTFGVPFPNNGLVGFAIMNNNNRSMQITSISTTTLVVNAFVGSTNNSFAPGDVFFWLAIGN